MYRPTRYLPQLIVKDFWNNNAKTKQKGNCKETEDRKKEIQTREKWGNSCRTPNYSKKEIPFWSNNRRKSTYLLSQKKSLKLNLSHGLLRKRICSKLSRPKKRKEEKTGLNKLNKNMYLATGKTCPHRIGHREKNTHLVRTLKKVKTLTLWTYKPNKRKKYF